MLDAQQSTGTGYTAMAALLSLAFIFIPALLIVSRPFGYFTLSLAIGCSALCAALAWILWRKTSRRSILSIVIQKGRREKTRAELLAIPLLCLALGAPAVRAADLSTYRGMAFGMTLSSAAVRACTSPSEATTVHHRPTLIQEMDYRSLSRALTQVDPYNLVRSGDQTSFALVLYSKRLDVLEQAAINEAVRLDALEAPQRELERQRKHDDEQRLSLEKTRSTNMANFRP